MWLLNAYTKQLEYFEGEQTPPYAILSHRWEQDEVLFRDIGTDLAEQKKGWRKIEFCCQQAIDESKLLEPSSSDNVLADQRGVYVWVDTCCIDKSNSAELSEAINSMYNWYQNARVCYAYLSDVSKEEDDALKQSVWFTRCWTLQELLAPKEVNFYDYNWKLLGGKSKLGRLINQVTGIPLHALLQFNAPSYSVAERMSWAASRRSTRKEDAAYALLGIFGVNMPMVYGEGSRAFQRLQEEILRRSEDLTILAWSGIGQRNPSEPTILAPSATYYRKSGLTFAPFILRHELQKLRGGLRQLEQWQGTSMISAGVSIDLYLIPFYPTFYFAPIARESRSLEDADNSSKRKSLEISAIPSIAHATDCSEVVCMIVSRNQSDGCFQRVSVDSHFIFRIPSLWLLEGRIRNVILENTSLIQLPSAMRSENARYGFWIESISNRSKSDSDIHLFSRAERSRQSGPSSLVLKPGYYGVAGMVRLNLPSTVTIVVFGFNFDFDAFCIVLRPNMPCDKETDISNLRVTAPRLRKAQFAIASNSDMMDLMMRLQSETEYGYSLESDSLVSHKLPWSVNSGKFEIADFGHIFFQKEHKSRLFFRVHISLRPQKRSFQQDVSKVETTWHTETWLN